MNRVNKQEINALPDVEVLGEWDHGMLDPVFKGINQPCLRKGVQKKILKVEYGTENAIWDTLHKVEHAVEEMIKGGDDNRGQGVDDELTELVDAGVGIVPT